MKKRDWKAAKKRLTDSEKPTRELDLEKFLRSQDGEKKSMTLYHREYWRFKRSHMPKNRRCPICYVIFFQRRHWRKMESTMVCRYCFALLCRREIGIRYLIDYGQLVNIFGKYPNLSWPAIATKLGISFTTLNKILKADTTQITGSTYRTMRAAQPTLRFTKNWIFHAPATLARLRGRAGWTVKDAADFLGLEPRDYWEIEFARRPIAPGYLDELIECLTSKIDSVSIPTVENPSRGEKGSETDTDSPT